MDVELLIINRNGEIKSSPDTKVSLGLVQVVRIVAKIAARIKLNEFILAELLLGVDIKHLRYSREIVDIFSHEILKS